MDAELKEYLKASFEAIDKRFEVIDKRFEVVDKRFEGMESRFDRKIDALAETMASEIGNLHSEMRAGFARVDEKLVRIDDRLDRQGFMLAGGTKALGGLLEHIVTVDSRYEQVHREMTELRTRVEQLERKAS